ncbi:GNAT family N-acetyltransferase [Tritonibacter scottomollicae]|uniref:GNAT family N-acetyltransferase n=1 Tax=Tritonibacter scottomollicae TaxID=483013 RepID=A0ABZ0HGA0_TRISK|nr:GNAT family N-acetyltransferase [Tritonibacter scottomollicae]WOI32971.1 GNAT family N-acetyltransferase [Tritonibacter scottomollicae]
MTAAPIIETDRLILRPHEAGDLDKFWNFFQSDRSKYMDAPDSRSQLWTGLMAEVGSWEVYGWGGLAIETKDGELAGQICISQPPHFPELELGWIAFEGFEGAGFAFEAASAMRDFAFEILEVPTLVSYIDQKNRRSIALADRMGAVLDPDAQSYDPADLVYRHTPDSSGPGLEAYA